MAEPKVVVGGLTPMTTIDYPGELAAVIFLQGCPWRCGYCQNSELLSKKTPTSIEWSQVIDFLGQRRGLLDAVVFSGGEPTLHTGLSEAIKQVSNMGFKIGLHTAGIYPRLLQKVLSLVDWVGMDIKASRQDYESITGIKGSGDRAWQSAKQLLESGVAHEFRTTVHPDMLSSKQLAVLIKELIAIGAKNYVIQECVTPHCLDETRRVACACMPTSTLRNQYVDSFESFSIRAAA